jgi:hypothetical protein
MKNIKMKQKSWTNKKKERNHKRVIKVKEKEEILKGFLFFIVKNEFVITIYI